MSRGGCPVCGGDRADTILSATAQPCLLNVLHETADEALAAGRADLHFTACLDCGFVFNRAFDPHRIVYGPGYVNDQSLSPAFRAHLDDVIERIRHGLGDRPGRIIEIGCGQGDFLQALCAATGRRGIGFDPACGDPQDDVDGVTIIGAPFTRDHAARLADDEEPVAGVCCRHVIEHLPDPVAMLRRIERTIRPSDGVAYIEVPAFEWISTHRAFYDLFHEHCSLFTSTSMPAALGRAGLQSSAVERVFGEQYLAVLAGTDGRAPATRPATPGSDPRAIAAALAQERRRVASRIIESAAAGPVLLWGAAAKGVSLVNHLGLRGDIVGALVDVNPRKQGRHVPVTGQPVLAPSALGDWLDARPGRATILVMNPNYVDEIRDSVSAASIAADVVAITDAASRATHAPAMR